VALEDAEAGEAGKYNNDDAAMSRQESSFFLTVFSGLDRLPIVWPGRAGHYPNPLDNGTTVNGVRALFGSISV
jgi:hypothetical protein